MSEFSAAQVTINQNGIKVSETNPLPVTLAAGGASGAATSDNQVTMIAQLDDLLNETENQGGFLTVIRDNSTDILEEIRNDTLAKRLTVRLDQVSDTLFYVGKALIGSLDSQDLWQIVRYTQTGSILKSEYANGDETFNQVWNNRTTLTYI
jgi:hypothetical protein